MGRYTCLTQRCGGRAANLLTPEPGACAMPDRAMPDIPRAIPNYLAGPLVKFLQHASPDAVESLLSTLHAQLQAGVTKRANESVALTRHILARDAS
jgi:hypothetical protein